MLGFGFGISPFWEEEDDEMHLEASLPKYTRRAGVFPRVGQASSVRDLFLGRIRSSARLCL